jgi:hypothetical protein
MGLAWYLNDLQTLTHDQNFLFTSQAQATRWINEARRQCAAKSGCIRRLVSGQSAFGASAQPGVFVPGGAQPGALPGAVSQTSGFQVEGAAVNSLQTIPGQERYPYQGFFNPYARAQHAGIKGIVDIIELSVNWGGAVRPTLAWLPWDELQAYARAYATLVTSYPYYYSIMDDGENGEVWMFPAPSTTGDIEADAFCVPLDLNSDDDYDAIPGGFQNAIKFGAASLAFMASQRYAQAQYMQDMFDQRIGTGRVQSDRGKTQNYYWNAF